MSILDLIIGILAPYDCLSCGLEGDLLCASCLGALPPCSVNDAIGPDIKAVYTVTDYRGEAKKLLWMLKSSGARAAAIIIARAIASTLPISGDYIIVPIPTATSRVRSRGYDQAKLIARELAKQTGLDYLDCLVRQGQTHQVGSDRATRIIQLASAFRLKSGVEIKDASILLVDDVMTTGSTIMSVANLLKLRGAKDICAATFARA